MRGGHEVDVYASSVSLVSTVTSRLPACRARGRAASSIANLVGEIGIVVTGGVVRLTGSGLGCPTWPECVPGSFTPVRTDESRSTTSSSSATGR